MKFSILESNRLGWHFDQSDFSHTAVSDNAWVCDNAYIVPTLYTCGTVGAIIGTLIFRLEHTLSSKQLNM
jgi:hypothetical protein